jgi:hypothetical protein
VNQFSDESQNADRFEYRSLIVSVSDARSNPNDQIAHAATVLKRSLKLRKVFEAICRGGKKPKTVSQLMTLVKYGQVEVLQLGGRLADQQLVHKTKVGTELAYEKDRFFAANRVKILRYATNPNALGKLPTKVSPRSGGAGPLSVVIRGAKVRIREITVEDIDQFAATRKVKNAPARIISEKAFKKGVQKLVGEKGKFQDWGGEPNDLFTTRVRIRGRRITTAFAFKGPGTSGILTPAKLGKNGDQIQRLFLSPADIFIIQYHAQIGQAVIEQMKAFATLNSVREGKQVCYGVIDGEDTRRLMAAYPNKFK